VHKKKYFILVNPAAGNGAFLNRIEKVKDEFARQGAPYDIHFTNKDLKADVLVNKNFDKNIYSDLLIVGGDGTINEAINGLDAPNIPISVISIGTGNDTIKHIQVQTDFESQLNAVFNGQIIEIDAGICNGRMFLNGVGIGFDGKVAERMAQKGRKFQGHLAYMSEVLRILLSYKENVLKARFDDRDFAEEVLLMTITKGTTFGGGFKINPFAEKDDGLLDICVIKKIPKWMRIAYVLRMKDGKHRNLSQVSFFKSKEVIIDPDTYVVGHMDGEYIGHPPFNIKVLPKALKIKI